MFFEWCNVVTSCVFRSLGPENLLLKGATLKNTKRIYGDQFIIIIIDKCRCSALNLERANSFLLPVCPGSPVAFGMQADCMLTGWNLEILVLSAVLASCACCAKTPRQAFLFAWDTKSCSQILWRCAGVTVPDATDWGWWLMFFLTVCGPYTPARCSGICAITLLSSLRGFCSWTVLEQCLVLQLGLEFHVKTDAPYGLSAGWVPLGLRIPYEPCLIPCRSCGLYWNGNKNGFELPREISETVCCRKVSIYSWQKKNR